MPLLTLVWTRELHGAVDGGFFGQPGAGVLKPGIEHLQSMGLVPRRHQLLHSIALDGGRRRVPPIRLGLGLRGHQIEAEGVEVVPVVPGSRFKTLLGGEPTCQKTTQGLGFRV